MFRGIEPRNIRRAAEGGCPYKTKGGASPSLAFPSSVKNQRFLPPSVCGALCTPRCSYSFVAYRPRHPLMPCCICHWQRRATRPPRGRLILFCALRYKRPGGKFLPGRVHYRLMLSPRNRRPDRASSFPGSSSPDRQPSVLHPRIPIGESG